MAGRIIDIGTFIFGKAIIPEPSKLEENELKELRRSMIYKINNADGMLLKGEIMRCEKII